MSDVETLTHYTPRPPPPPLLTLREENADPLNSSMDPPTVPSSVDRMREENADPLNSSMDPPTVPSNVDRMRQIRMAPSKGRMLDRPTDFLEQHDDYHQTIPKQLMGAERQEKRDLPKPCCQDKDPNHRDPDPDSSLPSIPSLPRKSSQADTKKQTDSMPQSLQGVSEDQEEVLTENCIRGFVELLDESTREVAVSCNSATNLDPRKRVQNLEGNSHQISPAGLENDWIKRELPLNTLERVQKKEKEFMDKSETHFEKSDEDQHDVKNLKHQLDSFGRNETKTGPDISPGRLTRQLNEMKQQPNSPEIDNRVREQFEDLLSLVDYLRLISSAPLSSGYGHCNEDMKNFVNFSPALLKALSVLQDDPMNSEEAIKLVLEKMPAKKAQKELSNFENGFHQGNWKERESKFWTQMPGRVDLRNPIPNYTPANVYVLSVDSMGVPIENLDPKSLKEGANRSTSGFMAQDKKCSQKNCHHPNGTGLLSSISPEQILEESLSHTEQHLSELGIHIQDSIRDRVPVEQSFSFLSTLAARDSLLVTSDFRQDKINSLLRFFIRIILSTFENKTDKKNEKGWITADKTTPGSELPGTVTGRENVAENWPELCPDDSGLSEDVVKEVGLEEKETTLPCEGIEFGEGLEESDSEEEIREEVDKSEFEETEKEKPEKDSAGEEEEKLEENTCVQEDTWEDLTLVEEDTLGEVTPVENKLEEDAPNFVEEEKPEENTPMGEENQNGVEDKLEEVTPFEEQKPDENTPIEEETQEEVAPVENKLEKDAPNFIEEEKAEENAPMEEEKQKGVEDAQEEINPIYKEKREGATPVEKKLEEDIPIETEEKEGATPLEENKLKENASIEVDEREEATPGENKLEEHTPIEAENRERSALEENILVEEVKGDTPLEEDSPVNGEKEEGRTPLKEQNWEEDSPFELEKSEEATSAEEEKQATPVEADIWEGENPLDRKNKRERSTFEEEQERTETADASQEWRLKPVEYQDHAAPSSLKKDDIQTNDGDARADVYNNPETMVATLDVPPCGQIETFTEDGSTSLTLQGNPLDETEELKKTVLAKNEKTVLAKDFHISLSPVILGQTATGHHSSSGVTLKKFDQHLGTGKPGPSYRPQPPETEHQLLFSFCSAFSNLSFPPCESHSPLTGGNGEKGYQPLIPERLDVLAAVAKVTKASDNAEGTGQGGNSSGSTNQSSSGGRDWGGARPKTTPQGNRGDNSDGDDPIDPNRRGNVRKVPDSLPLFQENNDRKNPRNKRSVPPRDPKRYRKKGHGNISSEELCSCLGTASRSVELLRDFPNAPKLDACMRLCLHDTDTVVSPDAEALACTACVVLHTMLLHYTGASHGQDCAVCRQLLALVEFHVTECAARGESEEEEGEGEGRNVCRRIRQAGLFAQQVEAPNSQASASSKVRSKVQKYLSWHLGPALLLDLLDSDPTQAEEATPPSSETPAPHGGPTRKDLHTHPAAHPDHGSTTTQPTTTKTPTHADSADVDNAHAAVMPKGGPNSTLRRRPSARVIPPRTIPEEPSSLQQGGRPQSEEESVGTPNLVEKFTPEESTGDEPEEDIFETYRERFGLQQEVGGRSRVAYNPDPFATQPTYGDQGTISMPEPRERLIRVEQHLSMGMQIIGVPGIGEVVYGTRQQLLLVARNWSQERDASKASGQCQYQHREEGVILDPFKKQLKILHTRYQKPHQWEMSIHLGNGVTGKCHLCIDCTSNFTFCCKEMHILQYEYQELDIWSELNHPNITRFYGAIRHGEKIYLFAECIDGGSLATLIKDQWRAGKRLSHWTALNYFRQLLQVLTYLQSMSVLHEDIKADNLLLRGDTTEIVLTDFGTAQQIPKDHTPPHRYPTGTPAHWSPEKAGCEGHGFASDVWAAACVLIHMLSGGPPWIGRFPGAGMLNFIIWSKPAPMEDVPEDVRDSVRELISCCLIKDKEIRPAAKDILGHQAFRILDQSGSLYSTLALPAALVSSSHPPQGMASSSAEATVQKSTSLHRQTSVTASAPAATLSQSESTFVIVSTSAFTPSGPRSLPASLNRPKDGNLGEKKALLRRKKSAPEAATATKYCPGMTAAKESERAGSFSEKVGQEEEDIVIPSTASFFSSQVESGRGVNTESSVYVTASSTSTIHYVRRTSGPAVHSHSERPLMQEQNRPLTSVSVGSTGQPTTSSAGQGEKRQTFIPLPLENAALSPLLPEPWPDMPSPVLTLASEVTLASQVRLQSLDSARDPALSSTQAASHRAIMSTTATSPASLPLPSATGRHGIPREIKSAKDNAAKFDSEEEKRVGLASGITQSGSLSQGNNLSASLENQSRGLTYEGNESDMASDPRLPVQSTNDEREADEDLTEEDIEISLPRYLSTIPENLDQEGFLSETTNSDEVAIFHYIREQLSWDLTQQGEPREEREQEREQRESLQRREGREPLQPYHTPPQSVQESGAGGSLPQTFTLPRFSLLHSASDTSTLKSSWPLLDSGESETLRSKSQPDLLHRDNPLEEKKEGAEVHEKVLFSLDPPSRSPLSSEALPRGDSSEEHISSDDLFGSGPRSNPAFQEASQYRELRLGEAATTAAAAPENGTKNSAAAAASPHCMSKKRPDLRLNVTYQIPLSTSPKQASSFAREQTGKVPPPNVATTSASSHRLSEDDAFPLYAAGTSPLTASSLTPVTRSSEFRSRSRNESGSSTSTPKSSTYDKQEQEWTALRIEGLMSPSLDLTDDPLTMEGSSTSSSSTNLNLFEQPAQQQDQEEVSMLSMLQEQIRDPGIGGKVLQFKNKEGAVLFQMRVRGRSKGWKELATAFRSKILQAGYRHFTLVHEDRVTPVDYFSTFDPSVTSVTVIEVKDSDENILSLCWCEDHVM